MPDMTLAIAILLGSFVLLLALRMPIAFTLGISSVVTALYLNLPIATLFQRMVNGVQSFSLMAIPFFILAGEIMGQGGISNRLIAFANALVGRMRGGLAQVNIVASMFFGGISGSAVADTSSIGSMLIPMMKKTGYDDDFSVAVTVTSACQGVMIPPSHNMILFALAAGGGVSIGQLFMGGLIPGILLGLALMLLTAIAARRRGYPKGDKMSGREILKATKDAVLGLLTCVIIVGGVIGGWFTATESAAVAVVYAFIVTFFIYREIPLRRFGGILRKSLRTIAMVMSLIATASMFGWLLAYLQIPAMVTNALLGLSDNRIVILLLINVMCLLLGCIMDMGPLILILTPILMPVATQLGMEPVQFGAMLILNLAIGLCTPPVGAALFVGCSIGGIKIEKATRACLPFYGMMVLVLLLITFWSPLSMFVPSLMLG
ncbi:TRAP transporter large permease [Butyricicoccus faecihominis]|uniref:TRAP transporter large permease n=1 Tax=Butyricicoccaceae TaxID=3085642 RepID=UPI00247B0FF9|nr:MULTISPECIES: TRAP transporter large permease [Butyricicoccaceae]MCQ5131294.1 TRAP transporter large permease [Butyricicoccus faecihominis]WNX83714.1 TRAP transporter large permease [Agathobaculum sp. NTUH-O15-33]